MAAHLRHASAHGHDIAIILSVAIGKGWQRTTGMPPTHGHDVAIILSVAIGKGWQLTSGMPPPTAMA